MTTTVPTTEAPRAWTKRPGAGAKFKTFMKGGGGVVLALLVVILAIIIIQNPNAGSPQSLINSLHRATPLMLLAMGQYFVIVMGEFDLSVGAIVTAQAAIAGTLIAGDDSKTYPVILLMLVIAVIIGLVNGLVVTQLKVPSFITTLSMMLILAGGAALWVGGGIVKGELSSEFRIWGRAINGIDVGFSTISWAVIVTLVAAALAMLLIRSAYGRTLISAGDSMEAAEFAGARVNWIKVSAFVLSAVAATLAAIIAAGNASSTVNLTIGSGLEFQAITAVVLGGVVLGGGKGSLIAAILGALTLYFIDPLFRELSIDGLLRPTLQGIILIAAVAYAARSGSLRRRKGRPTAA